MDSLSIMVENRLDKPLNEPFLHALKLIYPYQSQINEIKVKFSLDWRRAAQTLCRHISIDEEWEKLTKSGIKSIAVDHTDYPVLLKQSSDPPELLYYIGALPKTRINLAVVGSRKISQYGSSAVEEIINRLLGQSISIVSGLAYGIDAKAHRTSLDNKINTIAVLGSGVDQSSLYPSSHYRLAQSIIEAGGCVLSEFPPRTKGLPHHFPLRNRILAGISDATVVIEAAATSGALVTARFAQRDKRTVFAVPNDIFERQSLGSNNLLRSGAKILLNGSDLLKHFNLLAAPRKQNVITKDLTKNAELIINLLSKDDLDFEKLSQLSKLPFREVNLTLTTLEIKNIIAKLPSGKFTFNLTSINRAG